ncbi:MAG: metallophosphoesterase [Cystobacter sp.]
MSSRLPPPGRLQLFTVLFATVIQLPALLWACARTHSPYPALAVALLSLPYLRHLQTPWQATSPAPIARFTLGLWSVNLVFGVLLLPAALAIHLGVPRGLAWGVCGVLALLAGVNAVLGRPHLRRLTLRVEGLAPELEGYRIGQISDVHCGPYISERRVGTWVARLNALDVDLMTVTGDLITQGSSHVEAVSRALGGLRARDGVFACMGNHDYFTDGEQFIQVLEQRGLRVLRNQGVVVQRGTARLYVAGVDDTWTSRHDLRRALAARPAGVPCVLLAHDPNLFPQAVAHSVELTLSGHTHGGQLAVPGVRRLSLARFISRWTAGLYRRERSWLYVNRGAGTTGPPVRLGAPAELTVLTLRRA